MLDERRMQRNRRWLEEERERLHRELKLTTLAMDESERPGYGTHMADSATEVFEQARDLALKQRLEMTLEEVRRALEKMDSGTYFTCDHCGGQIDPARLKALPHAVLCKPCQARAEEMQRRR
jgi:RNA polymerase-binding transcription factor DksA